jgi:hypothetical protein
MKIMKRTAVVLFFAVTLLTAAPGMVWASCDTGNGIMLGTNADLQDFVWHFSLVNLTKSNITIAPKSSSGNSSLGSGFPYGIAYPPGNSANSKTQIPSGYSLPTKSPYLNVTTWKSNEHNKMFPDSCTTNVIIEIKDNTAYNFGLQFKQHNDQRQVRVTLQQAYGATTSWKYKTSATNDNGYYAYPAAAPDDDGVKDDEGEGILFAISDKYIVALYKNNMEGQGGNSLNLVVTERDPALDYHGNKVRYIF